MEDTYESYCDLLKRYQNEEDSLDSYIATLNKLHEQRPDAIDSNAVAGIIKTLKWCKADIEKKYEKTAKAMYEMADCLAEAMDVGQNSAGAEWLC